MSAWAEATAPDGRTYYWNKQTKQTSWTKPSDFDAPATPAGPNGTADDWSEAKAPDGRIYYYNKVTKKTRWDKPAVMDHAPRQNGRPDFVAGGGQDFGRSAHDRSEDRMTRRDDRMAGLPQKPSFDRDGPRGGGGGGMPWEGRRDDIGFRGPMPAKTDEPDYATQEQAEEAFFKLLKRHNITPDTEWQDALRLVIRDREYRAIKDPKERKVAYDKYCQQVRAEEKGKEKERKEKLREDFRKMLHTHDDIKHYTRWKTARPMVEGEYVFKQAGDEDERKRMFDEYIIELKKIHAEDESTRRKTAIAELNSMLRVLISDPDTRWNDAEEKITTSERFVSEDIFRALNKLDVFYAFENHMKALERVANEKLQQEKRLKRRRERQARDGFGQLLNEKLREGKIKAGSKWQDVHPAFASDPRFTDYVGLPGSDPLDLFWDIVEDEERKLRSKRNDAMDVLEERRYEMTLDTTFDQFMDVMQSHPKTSSLKDDELNTIFSRLMDKIKKRYEDSKLDAERHKRDAIDGIRTQMKRSRPAIRVDDTLEDVAQLLAGTRDWEAADEEMRASAYDKFMRRLKEREEHERDRARRDRDDRNGSRRDDRDRSRDRRHRTRTPEIDAYEADRRKAQEARERSYRKPSFGLTPPRDRRDDRYVSRDDDRRHDRRDGVSIYERERRERELERERSYISRADPRDKGKTLDYGDEDTIGSRPGSVRKRRDSDGSMRESKRSRRGESAGVLKDEEPALQSGSEEGEIEEV
ncbi:hypothetical protein DOTSEDRAFT_68630 [Dothistroma septosporum NZE10]|uniref:Formin binding protein-like protein n=1 Tax=Dothistroma septosporum (strain NZE10 / CBS 128990) TaxID=675120 RepID=N1Q2E8_DOTSN|nr:hypothetical protein DOTSEDRAFT_68630 [Dothistroma septosporum NZE10]